MRTHFGGISVRMGGSAAHYPKSYRREQLYVECGMNGWNGEMKNSGSNNNMASVMAKAVNGMLACKNTNNKGRTRE